MASATDPFLAAIRDAHLLDPARMHEITRWAADAAADPQGLARELTRRGWLTPHQVREVYRGKGKNLVLGPFIVLDLIGEGGMGQVFKAHHTRLGREVAVKVIRPEKLSKPAVVQRFQQEIRAAAQLSHPNVVLVLDADQANGTHFYAMEFVEGMDLARLVKERGPMPVPMACDYARQAALGLQHAAERGLVHRDVKPSNLLVTPRGQVKLLDLGLAMLKVKPAADPSPAGEDPTRITQDGLVLGTPDYVSPEQAQNSGNVDPRSDVYSLGGTLYFLLTGRAPYEGSNPTEKLVKHCTEPPPSLLAARPDVPPHLDAVVRWMMAKRPEERPQSPAEAALALAPFCGPPPGGATPLGVPHPAALAPAPAPPAGAADHALFAVAAPAEERKAAGPKERKAYKGPAGSGTGLKIGLAVGLLGLAVAGAVGLVMVLGPRFLADDGPPADEFDNPAKLKMVLLKPGSFTMGGADGEAGREPEEGPTAEVTLTAPFYISTTEVPYGQYVQIVGKAPPDPDKRSSTRRARNPALVPVDSVTWDEAVEFCRRLTLADRDRRRGWAYRLPTEAEWEYACRAGTTTPFSTGARIAPGKQIVCAASEGDPYLEGEPVKVLTPYPCGMTEPNPWKLRDMHGNAWEWCQDRFADYPPGPRTDPTGPADGLWRVVRGGAWDEPSTRCRSAARKGLPHDDREPNVGFRVVFAAVKE